jgi:Xaa-Pro aminopeptidase
MARLAQWRLWAGIPENDADLLYLARVPAPDPILYLDKGERRVLLVPDFEVERAKKLFGPGDVWGMQTLAREEAERKKAAFPDLSLSALALGALRRLGVRRLEVAGNCPVGLVERLRAEGIRVAVIEGELLSRRQEKSPDEIARIVEVQRHTERALAAAEALMRHAVIRRGYLWLGPRRLTAEDLRRAINLSLLEADCLASHTIVAVGDQAVDPHEEGHGPIRAGEPVVLDVFPRSMKSFYFADITRTWVRGRPTEALLRQYRAVYEAQRAAFRVMRAGASIRRAHEEVNRCFIAHGFLTGERDGRLQGFTHSTGHGVGLQIHEPPRVGPVDPKLRFREGMVVTVEPGLYYLGSGGVRIEDMVVITRTQIHNLTRYHKRFVL